MIPALFAAIRVFFRSRLATSLEVLALRQQVGVLTVRVNKNETHGVKV
jgi:hypothetical protein